MEEQHSDREKLTNLEVLLSIDLMKGQDDQSC
jgi:hypothetical protein